VKDSYGKVFVTEWTIFTEFRSSGGPGRLLSNPKFLSCGDLGPRKPRTLNRDVAIVADIRVKFSFLRESHRG
jgi:hypothetical protein